PVAGRVISDFGTNGSGQRNDGINIAAPLGTPIRAAASGTISYAGNELRGYGNLILIKHDDGYVTAYAHAERIVVNRGDTVTKGQIIAYAGSTGDVTSPQLHFEIRHGVQPVNPRTMLMASNAS
ncbi:MAG: murein hydrolase activator EnvC family protein, partial [Rhizomicrobium sp.]